MTDTNKERTDSPSPIPQFQLPKTDLLELYENNSEPNVDEDEVNNFKKFIEDVFHDMKVPIYGMRIDVGAAVIRYVVISIANIRASFVKNVASIL